MKTYTPSPQYLNKLRLGIHLAALLGLLGGVFVGFLLSLDPETDKEVTWIIPLVVLMIDLLWWLPALILAGAYYRSLRYEIQDDEVIVHVGIWTKSVKHVPYRTVTNLQVKRDIFDRWLFNIGTLNIQTAGMSGTVGAEESLVGLPDVQEVYDLVAHELRRFRRSMAPTTTEEEPSSPLPTDQTLSAILSEVRAIRQALQDDKG